jgi:hypothetical protein
MAVRRVPRRMSRDVLDCSETPSARQSDSATECLPLRGEIMPRRGKHADRFVRR